MSVFCPFPDPSLWMGRSRTELALGPRCLQDPMPKEEEGTCHWEMSLVFRAEGS